MRKSYLQNGFFEAGVNRRKYVPLVIAAIFELAPKPENPTSRTAVAMYLQNLGHSNPQGPVGREFSELTQAGLLVPAYPYDTWPIQLRREESSLEWWGQAMGFVMQSEVQILAPVGRKAL